MVDVRRLEILDARGEGQDLVIQIESIMTPFTLFVAWNG